MPHSAPPPPTRVAASRPNESRLQIAASSCDVQTALSFVQPVAEAAAHTIQLLLLEVATPPVHSSLRTIHRTGGDVHSTASGVDGSGEGLSFFSHAITIAPLSGLPLHRCEGVPGVKELSGLPLHNGDEAKESSFTPGITAEDCGPLSTQALSELFAGDMVRRGRARVGGGGLVGGRGSRDSRGRARARACSRSCALLRGPA